MAHRTLDKKRLRWLLASLFVALTIPTALLIRHAFLQLRTDALQQYQLKARDYAGQLDARLLRAMSLEDALAPAEFGFFVVTPGDAQPARSRLSTYPVTGHLPGIVGYFQVDSAGVLTTPLLPEPGVDLGAYGIGVEEAAERNRSRQRLNDVLANNRLAVRRMLTAPLNDLRQTVLEEKAAVAAPAGPVPPARQSAAATRRSAEVAADPATAATGLESVGQAVFDELASETGDGTRTGRESAPAAAAPAASPDSALDQSRQPAESPFADEIEAFQFNRLASGEFVIFRNVWQDGGRLVQGALIGEREFTDAAIGNAFRASEVGLMGGLRIYFADTLLAELARPGDAVPLRAAESSVHRERLSPPFADLELAFVPTALSGGPARSLLVWLSLIIAAVLSSGFLLLYRMLAGQIDLAEKQRNFISAVSHELKTPLTSIRMYGEMLAAGWADEDKRRGYYRYILDESERLTRLIDNVLRLAGLGHGASALRIDTVPVTELLDLVRSRVASQLEGARYELELAVEESVQRLAVVVDKDAFVQIMINLVDNAIKYSQGTAEPRVVIRAAVAGERDIVFSVRDYGPGVPRAKMKKLFELFYRPRDVRTRAVQGTGIGLSLVRELTVRMGGRVEVRNRDPGAEFSIRIPIRR